MAKIKDLTGQKFGRLTVIKLDPNRGPSGQVKWICQCECGNQKSIIGSNLTKGLTLSCGCLHKEKSSKNLIGQKFGRLLVIEKTDKRTPNRNIIWKCQCDCGEITEVPTSPLIQGRTCSCGCLDKERRHEKGTHFKDISGQRFGNVIALEPTSMRSSQNAIIWRCICDCGNECYLNGSYLRMGDVSSCGCMKSKGESLIIKILQAHNIKYEKEKVFEVNNNGGYYRFDFYINDSYLIEYDGIQHFQIGGGWNNEINFKKTQQRDYEKTQWCKENHIPLIRIPYTHLDDLCLEDLLLETSKFISAF